MAEINFTLSQDRAIHCIDKNVAVSAGAGSGKTRVLVQRFLYILSRGIKHPADTVLPREILAVTFTRKAAAEMSDRIRKEMGRKLSAGQDKAYWEQQLKGLPYAQIGTIHSFCGNLLRSNPVESNLDPDFVIMEETEHREFLIKEVRNRLRSLLHEQDQDAALLCSEYGSNNLQKQTLTLLQKDIVFVEGALTQKYEEALSAILQEVKGLQSVFTPEFLEACSPGNRAVLEGAVAKIQNALSDIAKQEHLDYLRLINRKLKRNGKNKDEIDGIKNRLTLVCSYLLGVKALSLVPSWERYLLRMQDFLRIKKQDLGVVSFDDLEERALDLLEHHPEVLAKCRRQFRYVMVDEFQDTNERQRQLVYLLCGGNKESLQDSSHLFVVGDAKQSIYRFRGADVSVFARVRNEIAATGGELIQLNDNFRTVDSILQFCNDVFPGIMGLDAGKDVYYEALQYHRQSEIKPEFCVLHYTKDVSASAARQAEAEWLANRLAVLHRDGTAYKDMAVLLQNMTHISVLTDALRKRSVPYVVADGRGFYEKTEIQDMLNLFNFVINPHDDLNLSGVLRSVYMGFDDVMLTRLHIALLARREETDRPLSLWDFLLGENYMPEQSDGQLLFRSVFLLRRLLTAGMALNLPDFCGEVQKLLHPEPILAMQDNGEEQLANLEKFFQMAKDFAARKQGTLQDFTLRFTQLMEMQDREATATVVSEDAIQLMTVHKAKGLEFPLVAVPFLDMPFKKDTAGVAWQPALGLGISVRDAEGELVPSILLEAIRRFDTEKELEEKVRLLYVAMTRSKDRLILSGSRKEVKERSQAKQWLNWIDYSLPEKYPGVVRLDIATEAPAVEQNILLPAATEKISENRIDALLEQTAPLGSFGGRAMTRFSASALQEYSICPRRYYYQVIENIPPSEEGEGQGNRLPAEILGTLVHEVLEKYAKWRMENHFAEDEQIWRVFYEHAVQEMTGGRFDLAKEAEVMLQDYLHSGLYQSFSRKQKFAEYGFQLPLFQDDAHMYIITGFIDAVIEQDDGKLEVIDYKSGKPSLDGESYKGYAWQLAFYKMALEALLQMRRAPMPEVTKASLHFLRNQSEWVLPEKDYRREIMQVCKEIAEKKDESDFIVKTEHCAYCPFAYMCKKK